MKETEIPVGRIYRDNNDDNACAIVLFVGQKYVVYHYFTDILQMFNDPTCYRETEETTDRAEFLESFRHTSFNVSTFCFPAQLKRDDE